jgi:hypothetical protein
MAKEATMMARLGNVLYWLGNAIAILWALLMAFALFMGKGASEAQILLGFALIPIALIWIAGRACLYVMVGR